MNTSTVAAKVLFTHSCTLLCRSLSLYHLRTHSFNLHKNKIKIKHHQNFSSTCVTDKGTDLLKASYERIGKMNDPVWIFVEGQRIDYHEDWLATICGAIAGKGKTVEECTYYADVRK